MALSADRPELWPLLIPEQPNLHLVARGRRKEPPATARPGHRLCSHSPRPPSTGRARQGGASLLPSVARTPQAAHMMRQGPTVSVLLSTDLGEMKIPEPMMVPTMMQMPLSRPTLDVGEGGALVPPPRTPQGLRQQPSALSPPPLLQCGRRSPGEGASGLCCCSKTPGFTYIRSMHPHHGLMTPFDRGENRGTERSRDCPGIYSQSG